MGKVARFLLTVAVVALTACGGSGGDDAVLFLAADEIGPDPFMADVAEPVPIEFAELDDDFADAAEQAEEIVIDELAVEQDVDVDEVVVDEAAVRQARLDAVVSTADDHGVQVQLPGGSGGIALYGGSGVNACDVEAMIQFLDNDNDLGAAWASVQGIDRSELRGYLESLTPGFLVLDTTVINHGFKNGQVTSNEATLEAGTAVLVDDQGNIRARCKCGNPQLPASLTIDGTFLDLGNAAFADNIAGFQYDPAIETRYRDPLAAIGAPDGDYEQSTSLGTSTYACEFFIIVEFVDNRLVDGPGPDLRVFESGRIEPSDIMISVDGQEYVEIGRVDGGASTIDIDGQGEDEAQYRFVRICDAPDADSSAVPGADIDAVATINGVRS